MTPTVGRIVHFHVEDGSTPVAAIIIRVHSEDCVDLALFPPGPETHSAASIRRTSVSFEGIVEGGSAFWRWPPRV